MTATTTELRCGWCLGTDHDTGRCPVAMATLRRKAATEDGGDVVAALLLTDDRAPGRA